MGHIIKKNSNGITTLTISNLPHNAMTASMLSQLEKHFLHLGEDENTKIIILQSEGEKTFCAGADFSELLMIKNEQQGQVFFSGFAQVMNAIRKCPKLVIVRVQGKAVGGGVGLAATADYCFASSVAEIKLSELSIGIGPFVIEPAITRKIGLSAFTTLTLNALHFFDAQWSHEKGLFQVVVKPEELDYAVEEFANRLVDFYSPAQKDLKQMFWEGTTHWDELLIERARISGRLVLSDFTRKTLDRFRKK